MTDSSHILFIHTLFQYSIFPSIFCTRPQEKAHLSEARRERRERKEKSFSLLS